MVCSSSLHAQGITAPPDPENHQIWQSLLWSWDNSFYNRLLELEAQDKKANGLQFRVEVRPLLYLALQDDTPSDQIMTEGYSYDVERAYIYAFIKCLRQIYHHQTQFILNEIQSLRSRFKSSTINWNQLHQLEAIISSTHGQVQVILQSNEEVWAQTITRIETQMLKGPLQNQSIGLHVYNICLVNRRTVLSASHFPSDPLK